MSFDPKLTDLKFHIDKIVPEDVCKYFIDFYENNSKISFKIITIPVKE